MEHVLPVGQVQPFALADLARLVSTAGVPNPQGLPFQAIVAAIANAESAGYYDALGDTTIPSGPSAGLFQVNKGAWPDLFQATVGVINDPTLSPEQKAVKQIQIVKPILAASSATAVDIGNRLMAKGFPVDGPALMQLVDAAWQSSPRRLQTWVNNTKSGAVSEIDERAPAVWQSVAALAGQVTSNTLWEMLAIAALGMMLVYALNAWNAE